MSCIAAAKALVTVAVSPSPIVIAIPAARPHAQLGGEVIVRHIRRCD
jgi:hypothetical protein